MVKAGLSVGEEVTGSKVMEVLVFWVSVEVTTDPASAAEDANGEKPLTSRKLGAAGLAPTRSGQSSEIRPARSQKLQQCAFIETESR